MDSVTNNHHFCPIFGERILMWKICCFDVNNIFQNNNLTLSTKGDIENDYAGMMRLVWRQVKGQLETSVKYKDRLSLADMNTAA